MMPARVLRNSEIYNNAEEGNVISAGKSVVGGGAYPLRKWLITPYISCNNVAPVTNLCLGRVSE
jgi:hypothetical protein